MARYKMGTVKMRDKINEVITIATGWCCAIEHERLTPHHMLWCDPQQANDRRSEIFVSN